jgi:hypothetical protein
MLRGMGTLLQIALVYLLPAIVAFFWFRWSDPVTKIEVLARVIFVLMAIGFVAQMGLVARYGVYGPYVWSAGAVLGALSRAPRIAELPLAHEPRDLLRGGALVAAGALLVAIGVTSASSARSQQGAPVHLTFPLHGGTYLVLEGGGGAFFGLAVDGSSQRFGVDLAKIDAFGFRADTPWPTAPEGFVIFDDAVSAPCDGKILAAEDDKPDLPPSQGDSLTPLGNFVAIGCPDATVVFAHLRRGSLVAPKNVSVHVGDAVARVGASGRGGEAKLRMFALRGAESSPDRIASQAEGIPIAFGVFGDGALVRGDRLSP